MARPRTQIGTFGEIYYEKASGGRFRAFARFRDHDGVLRRIQATAPSQQSAARKLKELLAERVEQTVGQSELSGSSSFQHLVEVWLADLGLERKVAPSTRAPYKRNMEKLVLPAFANYTLREITVRKVGQFIKTLAAAKSYSTAKQARTVLSPALGLAVRYDAISRNPVRDTVRLQKRPSQAMALTTDQVQAIRDGTRTWRGGPGFSGPPPDGQLEQIIEGMLGTSVRIGEVLAIRKCDVDVTNSPATVRLPRSPPCTRRTTTCTAPGTSGGRWAAPATRSLAAPPERLVSAEGLKGVQRAKSPRTTRPMAETEHPADLVERKFVAERPNQFWVADITYVRTYSGWVRGALIIVVYSRMIVSWQLSKNVYTDLALDALNMAIWQRIHAGDGLRGLVHLSDRAFNIERCGTQSDSPNRTWWPQSDHTATPRTSGETSTT